jgi:hypothetical protein
MSPVEIFIKPESNSCFSNWFLGRKWRIRWQEEVAYSPHLMDYRYHLVLRASIDWVSLHHKTERKKAYFSWQSINNKATGICKCQRKGECGVHLVLIGLSVAVRFGMSPELRLLNVLRLPKDGFLSTAPYLKLLGRSEQSPMKWTVPIHLLGIL